MTDFAALRTAMVDCQVRPSDVTKFPIIDAMLNVPRECYVPDDKRSTAYTGDDIGIGEGRVVLDPRVLAKMLDVLDVQRSDLVLDLGCGLGYSSAVIGWIAEAVVAVEEDETMAQTATQNLLDQSVDNAVVICAPLTDGTAKYGPYDAVLVGGAVEEFPASLAEQIKDGGRIACIFMDGALGQCRIGLKRASGIEWRVAFDATAPVLNGFEKKAEFAF